jgi:hypothetical protein
MPASARASGWGAEGTVISPGGYVVIVRDLEAFRSRYITTGMSIAGEYVGNLENRGERIAMVGALGEPILDMAYDDLWFEETDGRGYSLVSVDPWDPADRWSDKESWQPSSAAYGSPGEADSGIPDLGGWQRPGDANQDGALDISDAVAFLRYFFGTATLSLPCEDEITEEGNMALLDVNGDAVVNIADAVSTLAYLFADGLPPALGTSCTRMKGCPHACVAYP